MIRRLKRIQWIVIPTYNKDQPTQTLHVGVRGVEKIEEYIPSNEGLLWHYDVVYDDGTICRQFDVLAVGADWYEN